MKDNLTITLATPAEEEEVENFLFEVNMGLSGDIDEHVLLKENDELIAVAKFTPVAADEYHLDTMVVRADRKGGGIGKYFLGKLLSEPWTCFEGREPVDTYKVTTLSRGTAVPFYKKLGFEPCNLEDVHWQYVDQCDSCPLREECQPEPLIYRQQAKGE